jgi:nitrate reductase gamma subunit
MGYRILADLVVGLHALFVVLVLAGGVLALRWPWVAAVHLPAAVWGALIEFQGWICPLTPLENSLRASAGQAGYSGGFIEHYLLPAIYPSGLTRTIQLVLGLIVVVVNIVVYWLVLRRRIWRRRLMAASL